MIKCVTAAALLSLVTACATARQTLPELVSDRPDATESAVSIPPGHVQVETGYTLTRSAGVNVHTLGEVLARIGLGPGTELRVELSSVAIVASTEVPTRSGLDDASVGAKVELPSTRLFPETALLVMTAVPTGSSGFGEGGWRPTLLLASGWSMGQGMDGGVNAGWTRSAAGGEAVGSAAVGVELAHRWGGFVETFGSMERGGARRGFVNGGFTFALTRDLQWDVRLGTELGGAGERFFGGGLVTRW